MSELKQSLRGWGDVAASSVGGAVFGVALYFLLSTECRVQGTDITYVCLSIGNVSLTSEQVALLGTGLGFVVGLALHSFGEE